MTDMTDMTRAEILDIWKGFVRNMTDQGAVVPFAHEIASRVRNELLARIEAAEKERNDVAQQLVQSEIGKREISEQCDFAKEEVERLLALAHDQNNELIRLREEGRTLRAKIAEMEKQEPAMREYQGRDGAWHPFIDQRHYENTVADGTWPIRALYTLPGAGIKPDCGEAGHDEGRCGNAQCLPGAKGEEE